MAVTREKILHTLTSRRGAVVALLLLVALAFAAGAGARAIGDVPRGGQLPAAAESMLAADELATFPDRENAPVLAVYTRADGGTLTAADRDAIGAAAESFTTRATNGAGPAGGPRGTPVRYADDGRAALALASAPADLDSEAAGKLTAELRHAAGAGLPSVLRVEVTGGVAFAADIAGSFAGADVMLLLVTVGIVALLLLLTYRSPVLWLIPLAVVAIADQTAGSLDTVLAHVADVRFDAGIISVLVFGAGTNYALLLVSRYREELRRHADHREALRVATAASTPAIVAGNLTVVLALLTLLAATVPATRGIGVAAAVGLAVALIFVLVGLPAALSLAGRRVFWPFIPSDGEAVDADDTLWGRLAGAVVGRPVQVLVAAGVGLAICAAGLVGGSVGLDQRQQFRVPMEASTGLGTVIEHFGPGSVAPTTVIVDDAAVAEATAAVRALPRVQSVRPAGRHDGRTALTVTSHDAPGSRDSHDTVAAIREATDIPGAHPLVGGQNAESRDARVAALADLWTVVPLVLLVVTAILVVLLQSVLAPLLFVLANIASALAAIGLGTYVGTRVFDFPALDANVPLLAFLFLVALGIDYTVFLAVRIREEAVTRGTLAGVTRAVAVTGGVITSAGVVLAAVFAALGVLPLVTLGQLGLIVCLGVLLDTVVVRTMVVPALVAACGDAIWWPRKEGFAVVDAATVGAAPARTKPVRAEPANLESVGRDGR